jgi:hypothetical protein
MTQVTKTYDDDTYALVPIVSPTGIWEILQEGSYWADLFDYIPTELPGVVTHSSDPVAWMWKEHGWVVTAHSKHRSVLTHVDTCTPPLSTQASHDFISLAPLYTHADLAEVEQLRQRVKDLEGHLQKSQSLVASMQQLAEIQVKRAERGAQLAQQDGAQSQAAEEYLRGKYGAYRGHFAWREIEEAFIAGEARRLNAPQTATDAQPQGESHE